MGIYVEKLRESHVEGPAILVHLFMKLPQPCASFVHLKYSDLFHSNENKYRCTPVLYKQLRALINAPRSHSLSISLVLKLNYHNFQDSLFLLLPLTFLNFFNMNYKFFTFSLNFKTCMHFYEVKDFHFYVFYYFEIETFLKIFFNFFHSNYLEKNYIKLVIIS